MLSPERAPAPGPTFVLPIEDPCAVLGGLGAQRRLHALHPAQPGHTAAATGFGLALIQALDALAATQTGSAPRPILWVVSRAAARESGRPYGPGLRALGLAPERLIIVRVEKAMDAFAAAEMGLDERGLAGVLVDLPARLPADLLRLGQRLSLRAEARATPCLLLHATPEPVEAPVASRWLVASGPVARGIAPDFSTAFDLTLTKNRTGAIGRFAVAWRRCPLMPGSLEHAFTFVPLGATLSRRLAADAIDGSVAPERTSSIRPFPVRAA